ncbi:hypothetical protein SAMN05443582_103198 [Phyllobacterium sp. OV277]|nr:hypothetical protein SAMN05443582_103198 [Phyllobacterium sp. OV277]
MKLGEAITRGSWFDITTMRERGVGCGDSGGLQGTKFCTLGDYPCIPTLPHGCYVEPRIICRTALKNIDVYVKVT